MADLSGLVIPIQANASQFTTTVLRYGKLRQMNVFNIIYVYF
jgi:hypothetical protein